MKENGERTEGELACVQKKLKSEKKVGKTFFMFYYTSTDFFVCFKGYEDESTGLKKERSENKKKATKEVCICRRRN